MRLSAGFSKFAKENNLSEGVTYVFELIKKEPVLVLLVTAFHKVKNLHQFYLIIVSASCILLCIVWLAVCYKCEWLWIIAMQTRRGRHVLSAKETEVMKLKHFKKAILPSPIHAKQIVSFGFSLFCFVSANY